MKTLGSYLGGEWVHGNGRGAVLVNATTEEPLAEASTEGLDLGRALGFAREVGGPALRALTFRQRGEVLRTFSRAIHARRDELMALGIANAGNTRSDAKFDIDGASGTLMFYAELANELGDAQVLVDGDAVALGKTSKLLGQHILSSLHGAAVHINAFNFPAWGLAEKAAVALLAGVPVVTKPATSTALMAHRLMEIAVAEAGLPRGALSFVAGSPGDLVTHLRAQDVLAFTGSGSTGAQLRATPNVIAHSVRVNVEADSLNAAMLGVDVEPGSETWDLFLKDVVRDITQKAGQKCTAIRRVFVPRSKLEAARDALVDRLADAKVGDPSNDSVIVGPLATKRQQQDILAGIALLVNAGAKIITGGGVPNDLVGADPTRGFFVAPTLLETAGAFAVEAVHDHEVFGPVTTLLPYDDTAELVRVIRRGGGGLVSSIYSDDKAFVRELVFGVASALGRIVVGSEKIAGGAIPPGTVMPGLVHGGPGRAGGGEELGGLRGLALYLQRTAVQGYGPLVQSLFDGQRRVG
ncbi:MAG: 3,4-dehydroadipyl-CoA semialdehyde dehydrogenase [Polyangiales bacterium]